MLSLQIQSSMSNNSGLIFLLLTKPRNYYSYNFYAQVSPYYLSLAKIQLCYSIAFYLLYLTQIWKAMLHNGLAYISYNYYGISV